VAFIEITEPGVNRGADVADDGDGPAEAVAVSGAIAAAPAVAVGSEFAAAAVPAVADWAPVDTVARAAAPRVSGGLPPAGALAPEETVTGAVPSAWETVPPQLPGRQLRVWTVAG